MVVLLVIAAFAIILLCHMLWRSSYWQRNGIYAPTGIPFVGNMLQFFMGRKHYGDVYEKLYNEHANLPYIGIYRFWNEPAVLLRSQELIKDVMIRNFQHFQDNVLWVDPKRDPVIWCNPFIAKGDKWKHMRAEILPIFTPNKVKSTFPHIESICRKLQTFVDNNMDANCFEAKDLFSKYTLDVVASAAYGLDAESFTNNNSDFTHLVENLFMPNPWSLIETIALLFSPTLGNLIRYHYVPPGVQNWLSSIIGSVLQGRLKQTHSSSTTLTTAPSDFIQWLIEAKEKSHEPVDIPTIVGHCGTFLLEGFETSSSLMAFALFEYAKNQHIQKLVLAEIDEVLARNNGVLCYEALHEMPYFEATLYETLRLYPPMLALLKHCTKPLELPPQKPGSKQFVVPEGMVFVIPVKGIHNDSRLYPEPNKFDPNRFTAQNNDKQRLGCAFLGFGEGPRMCPGMRFGLAQSKAGIITLLSKYSVHLASKTKLPLKISPTTFLTAADNGIWISFKLRN